MAKNDKQTATRKGSAATSVDASSQAEQSEQAETSTPTIVVVASMVMKAAVILLACWAAWLALSVFSGFTKPVGQTAQREVAAAASTRSQASRELQVNEPIVSVPLHELLQGQWRVAKADWTIKLRALPSNDPQQLESELLKRPSRRVAFRDTSDLQLLRQLAQQHATKHWSDEAFSMTRVQSDHFDAVVFADLEDRDRIYFLRAVSRLTSKRPLLIEIAPATTVGGEPVETQPIAEYEFPIHPDNSFVITDQMRRDTSLVVVPVPRDKLLQFWIENGWQVHELVPEPGVPVYLKGVRENVRVEFLDESPTHTSIVAQREPFFARQ